MPLFLSWVKAYTDTSPYCFSKQIFLKSIQNHQDYKTSRTDSEMLLFDILIFCCPDIPDFILLSQEEGEWLSCPILDILSTATKEILNSLLNSEYPDSISVLISALFLWILTPQALDSPGKLIPSPYACVLVAVSSACSWSRLYFLISGKRAFSFFSGLL